MSKKLFFSVLCVFAIVMLAGCQKKVATSNAGGKTAIRVLNYYDLTTAGAQQELTEVWEGFDKAYGDTISVTREDLFNEPFHQKTEAYAAANQLPDVIYAWPSGRSTTLHTNKLLKDLGPLAKRDNLAANFLPAALDPAGQAGGYLAIIPQAITSSHAFYVNTKVLADAGLTPATTYEELKAQVPVLKAKGLQTVLMSNQDTWVMQSCLFSMIAGRFCGEGWEKKIHSGEKKFTDADFVAALQFVKTLYDDGVIDKASITTDYGSVVGQFATGKGAYLVDGDWRIGAFITDSGTGQALIKPADQQNIKITVFPDIPGAKLNKSTSTIIGTGWGMAATIPVGSAREAAAWEMIKWLTSKDIITWRFKSGAFTTPTRTDLGTVGGLEPMQIAGGNLGNEYNVGTAVFDGVFDGPVQIPINEGLQALGMGGTTPQRVAQETQVAFEAWRASPKN